METVNLPSDEELVKLLNNSWTTGLDNHYIAVKDCKLPVRYLKLQKDIDDFEVYESDIWICTFPRSGTTWASEMAWLIANNFDFEKAKTSRFERVRFLELSMLFDDGQYRDLEIPESLNNSVQFAKNQSPPRFIKTHLPFNLLPKQIRTGEKKPKIIYVMRNPLDASISFYYHLSSMNFSGTLEEFCQLFITGNMLYGNYWNHILPFWNMREQNNILFLKFEDMKLDLPSAIKKTAIFLGKFVPDEIMKRLQNHLSFESMKENPSVNGCKELKIVKRGKVKTQFVRAGNVGGYKTEMPQKYIHMFENWMKVNLEQTGISF